MGNPESPWIWVSRRSSRVRRLLGDAQRIFAHFYGLNNRDRPNFCQQHDVVCKPTVQNGWIMAIIHGRLIAFLNLWKPNTLQNCTDNMQAHIQTSHELRIIGPISLAWRLGGDSSLRWLRRHLCDVSWRLAGSPGSRGKFKHVQFFWRLFQSPAGLGDVSATWERKPCFGLPSRREWSVSAVAATSPWWERKPFFGLPSRPSCHNWSVAVVPATSPPVR